ncbi:response regulator transcription factor [Vreelandella andesensis]|uniref:response regulator transcription factor n=1 Tax=Vreelandella andesensis TaxID=447567 RepID=UPI00142D8140|nr:response regulator transcription factor [Halomonas andesensis]
MLITENHHTSMAVLTDFLHLRGFTCVSVLTSAQITTELDVEAQHILLFDSALPAITSESLIRALRRKYGYRIGIIVLLPSQDLPPRLAAWRCGADMSLVRPVNFEELDSVIWGLYQRLRLQAVDQSPPTAWMLYPEHEVLTPPDGQRVRLTGAETRLLTALAQQEGQVVSRQVLDEALAPGGLPGDTLRLNVLISRLKKKIKTETGIALPLQTYRNLGYAFQAEVVTTSGAQNSSSHAFYDQTY